MKVSQLQNVILGKIAEAADACGLEDAGGGRFFSSSNGVTTLLTVVFLDRRHAATFRTSTASFSLEAGIHFSDCPVAESSPKIEVPEHYHCQIRQLFLRDFRQDPPSDDLSEPDRKRRDIWWVSRDGCDLDKISEDAAEVVKSKMPGFGRRFGNPKRALRYFRFWRLTQWIPNGPFSIGRPDSPGHRDLIRLLRVHSSREFGAD